MTQMNELAFYTLAGQPNSPRELIDELQQAEALGIGACFISERFNIKEAATLSGAVGAVSREIGIATAATNHNTRHPLVTASYAMTMHKLTGGRFSLGLGRGIAPMFKAFGLPSITTAQLEDFAKLMRRLWRGETVVGHDGPCGKFPVLTLGPDYTGEIPLTFTAFGPNSLALGGRAMDAVVLHTFFTDETTARCVREVKAAAEKAGRDPAKVRVWSCFATIGDHLPEPVRLKKTVGRMATYLQGYGELMVRTNRWDPAALARFRSDPLVANFRGAIDARATTAELEQIAKLIPAEWLAPAATGSPARCVAKIREQLALGCDGVILHGASPTDLGPIVREYAKTRPVGKYDHLHANPAA
ncbi:MAG: TIGR03857 family LLM class F420-dependent oxidoreductase [Deltaproteobacteria bacterium]|nr:TIGR03857 family LLM class F420-dependent oxidoreductase [Deltaproteobacteria bacterium]